MAALFFLHPSAQTAHGHPQMTDPARPRPTRPATLSLPPARPRYSLAEGERVDPLGCSGSAGTETEPEEEASSRGPTYNMLQQHQNPCSCLNPITALPSLHIFIASFHLTLSLVLTACLATELVGCLVFLCCNYFSAGEIGALAL